MPGGRSRDSDRAAEKTERAAVLTASCLFQDISRIESELVNLSSHIQMQEDGVEANNAELQRIKEQIEQVAPSGPRPSRTCVLHVIRGVR